MKHADILIWCARNLCTAFTSPFESRLLFCSLSRQIHAVNEFEQKKTKNFDDVWTFFWIASKIFIWTIGRGLNASLLSVDLPQMYLRGKFEDSSLWFPRD